MKISYSQDMVCIFLYQYCHPFITDATILPSYLRFELDIFTAFWALSEFPVFESGQLWQFQRRSTAGTCSKIIFSVEKDIVWMGHCFLYSGFKWFWNFFDLTHDAVYFSTLFVLTELTSYVGTPRIILIEHTLCRTASAVRTDIPFQFLCFFFGCCYRVSVL